MVLIIFTVLGFARNGPRYLLDVVAPPGVPKLLLPIIGLIELVSTFVLRPLTLTVRLFANMVAGHILLTIIFIAVHAFFTIPGPWLPDGNFTALGLPLGAILLVVVAPLALGFEIFIASLQAYIFVMLTAVYIGGALHPEH